MDDYLSQLVADLKKQLQEKQENHQKDEIDIQSFQDQLRYLSDFSWDAVQAIRAISLYSTRASYIYDHFLTIRASDDIIQSIISLRHLVINGVHNMARREIRYILETTVKFLVVDQEQNGKILADKTAYLGTAIPNSSIEVVDRTVTPFPSAIDQGYKNEIKDLFYKVCAYVHPSQRQIEEQLNNYGKGYHLGFETVKMLGSITTQLFRTYDISLTLLFIGFGPSTSKDLFREIFNDDPKWKFHKGKYVKQYAVLY
ncbi:MAG TPA: hypothetical protein VHE34_31005 [Puia sp.]|uniref:hypothetical protein n=1 Tax=Puia sp. TaxID=2045100 RepID=UPI002C37930B|nr:hypothetical protein [Puia sp.]HVU99706.1 hypothetical protein [Puia sp.]